MEVFCHHLYEYKKGLRRLVLHTMNSKYRQMAEAKLHINNIDYIIEEIDENKINLFFGNKSCLEILKGFDISNINNLTIEQDFILGVMLGYDLQIQCNRYLSKKEHLKKPALSLIK